MSSFLRRHITTMLVAMVTAAVTAGGPALADGVRHALFAHNADKVDGKHAVNAGASVAARKGKLVATGSNGRLPNNIIAKAPDANLLDGINSTAFLRANGKAADADKLDGLDSTAFLRHDQSATVRSLHFMDQTGLENDLVAGLCTNYAGIELVVQAPGPGVVEVSGTVQVKMNHTNGTGTFAFVRVGSTTSDCGDGAGAGHVSLPASQPTGIQYHTVPVTRTFTIPAAGTYNYYVNGAGTSTARYYWGRLNGTFFPTG